jgi:hypothetical protein
LPTRAVLLGAGWVINVAVAEYVIRRRSQLSARAPRPSARPMEPHAGLSR